MNEDKLKRMKEYLENPITIQKTTSTVLLIFTIILILSFISTLIWFIATQKPDALLLTILTGFFLWQRIKYLLQSKKEIKIAETGVLDEKEVKENNN